MADSDLNVLSALLELHKQDPYQAVYFADYLGTHHTTLEQYDAAWRIMEVQTEFPCCRYCRWAILPSEPHELCQRELAPVCELCGRLILPGEPHTGCAWYFDRSDDDVTDYGEPSDGYWSDFGDEYDPYEETENPLAGDIDSPFANYEEPPGPFEAQRLYVASQYGG